jgi:large subunit ribosomal protein L10
MPSIKNRITVETLKERLAQSAIIISTSFVGLGVVAMDDLRRALREKGIEYQVVKNTLAAVAADQSSKPEIRQVLYGQTGLLLSSGDPVEVAKTLTDYIRTSRISLTVQGAVLDDRLLSSSEVTSLAALPPRPELVAQLAGQLVGLMAGLVATLNRPAQALATVLNGPSRSLATVLQRQVGKLNGNELGS